MNDRLSARSIVRGFRVPARVRLAAHRIAHLMLMLSVFVWPALALAQRSGAPSADLQKGPKIWFGYLMIFVFFAAIIVISLMPSKRSHQD